VTVGNKRTLVQIDAQNIFYAARPKGLKLDYRMLKESLAKIYGENLHIITYIVQTDGTSDGTMQALVHGLQEIKIDSRVKRTNVGKPSDTNHDTNMIIEAVTSLEFFDTLVIFSGDGGFNDLFRYYQEKGKDCHVWSFRECMSPFLLENVNSVHILDKEKIFTTVQ